MPFRLLHCRRGHGCLYSWTLIIWNAWSYEPWVIMLGLFWKESQGAALRPFLVKASWHAPLIYPLTKEKENWTKLRTDTTEFKLGSGIGRKIFDSIQATVSGFHASLRMVQRVGWSHSCLGCSLCNSNASWWLLGKKNSMIFILNSVLWSRLWALWFAGLWPGLKENYDFVYSENV